MKLPFGNSQPQDDQPGFAVRHPVLMESARATARVTGAVAQLAAIAALVSPAVEMVTADPNKACGTIVEAAVGTAALSTLVATGHVPDWAKGNPYPEEAIVRYRDFVTGTHTTFVAPPAPVCVK